MAFLDGDSVLSRPGGKDSKPLIGLGILHSTASQRVFGPPVGQEADSSVRYYYNPVTVSVCFGAKEFSPSNIVPSMSNWSELAVQFELSLPTNLSSKSRISFPISRGSAYVTALYTVLTPTLGSTHSIISLECANRWVDLAGLLTGQQAGCTSHLNLQKITPTDLGHPGAWSGIIQLVKMSDHYGRQLEENSHRQYSFDWITGGPRCNSVAPLMFALPHTEALSDPTIVVEPEIRMQSRVTGVMRLCRAARWLFKENVADLRRYGIKPDYLPNGPHSMTP
ncbi:hypothetical protein H4Q26_011889 [Puccinia striiformis f. sp. tritici PST-130]|nr:hypothetical protein H4Q26_011889 [Puccinia striiformis f. sp. tritici PST-130]